jgi:hypothetical protein
MKMMKSLRNAFFSFKTIGVQGQVTSSTGKTKKLPLPT